MGQLILVSSVAVFALTLVQAETQTNKIQVRDWTYLNGTKWISDADSRASILSKLAYGFCDKEVKNKSVSCTFHLESYESMDENLFKCTKDLQASEQSNGPVFRHPMMFDLTDNESKIITGYFDVRNGQRTLVIRLIDMTTCKSHDILINPVFSGALTYNVIPYKNSFDVFYLRDSEKSSQYGFDVFKMTFDKNGRQIGDHVQIFADIPQDMITISWPLMSQVYPIVHNGTAKAYFFLSGKNDQVMIISLEGQVMKSQEIAFMDPMESTPSGNNSIALVTGLKENTMYLSQLNEDLEFVQNITYEVDQGRKFEVYYVASPQEIFFLTSDSAKKRSEKDFSLERIVAGDEQREKSTRKSINIGKLHFEEWPVYFYPTYPTDQVCINALSSADIEIKALKFVCVCRGDFQMHE